MFLLPLSVLCGRSGSIAPSGVHADLVCMLLAFRPRLCSTSCSRPSALVNFSPSLVVFPARGVVVCRSQNSPQAAPGREAFAYRDSFRARHALGGSRTGGARRGFPIGGVSPCTVRRDDIIAYGVATVCTNGYHASWVWRRGGRREGEGGYSCHASYI